MTGSNSACYVLVFSANAKILGKGCTFHLTKSESSTGSLAKWSKNYLKEKIKRKCISIFLDKYAAKEIHANEMAFRIAMTANNVNK